MKYNLHMTIFSTLTLHKGLQQEQLLGLMDQVYVEREILFLNPILKKDI